MKNSLLSKGFLILSMITFLFADQTFAQKRKKSDPSTQSVKYDESLYKGIEWRLVGPFRGGRSCTATGVIGNPNLYYMGSVGGGVWKTQDGGSSWECISDGFFGGSIGAVAVSESDPNVIYVGEGEQTVRGNVSSGWGMWKSTDAGKTWKSIGLKQTFHIGRIRIHPDNPDLVYVAAMGSLWKDNTERGVFRSSNGGETWEKILYAGPDAGAIDLILDPNNARIIYASTWNIRRNGYRMDSGGPDSKLWKSTDSGNTWDEISDNPGFTKMTKGIIGIAVSPVNSERLWAIVEAQDGGVFRSEDAGKTWKKINENRALRQRAWYYSRIYADTQDVDKVWVMNVSYGVSTDGGKTFQLKNAPHGDHHDLWIDPNNNQRMIIADDGGAQISTDAGENWTTYHNQPTAQFYRVTTDNHFPYRIYGAQQDNSSVRIAHRSMGSSITERDWEPSTGGESAHLAPDPENPEIVYGGTYKGYMMRLNHTTNQVRSTNVWPLNPAGSGAEVMKYRFNWNFPVFFSPHNPNKLYATSNYIHATTNEGQSWEVISPDLTRNRPETIYSSGGPITQDNTGVEFYANVFAATESPYEEGVIWAGSDDGLIHVTRDGGKNWENVTPPTSPELNMMNCIDVNPFVKGGAYVAATSYKFGDYTPYLYKTEDYGKTWKVITKGIDPNHYTRAIRADPGRKGLLYAGTEWGMYISFDDGASWQPFQLNLPIVSIRDLHVRDNNLIAATHGRSFWMIDDLKPLHQLSDEIASKGIHLFQPKDSYRMNQSGGWGRPNMKLNGVNHPNGVILQYFVKGINDSTKVKIDILELDGDLITSFERGAKGQKELKVKEGGNRMVWNMRYPGFKTFPGMVLYSSPNVGPKAVPGTYIAKLTVEGQSVEQQFKIVKDPRVENTPDDYQKQFDFIVTVRDKINEAHQGILDIRQTKEDLKYLKNKIKDMEDMKEIMNEADRIEKELSIIENNIHQTKNQSRQDPLNFGIKMNNHLTFLMGDQQRGDFPPTDQAEEVRKEVSSKVDEQLEKLNEIFEKDIQNLNNSITNLDLPMIKQPTKEIIN